MKITPVGITNRIYLFIKYQTTMEFVSIKQIMDRFKISPEKTLKHCNILTNRRKIRLCSTSNTPVHFEAI